MSSGTSLDPTYPAPPATKMFMNGLKINRDALKNNSNPKFCASSTEKINHRDKHHRESVKKSLLVGFCEILRNFFVLSLGQRHRVALVPIQKNCRRISSKSFEPQFFHRLR